MHPSSLIVEASSLLSDITVIRPPKSDENVIEVISQKFVTFIGNLTTAVRCYNQTISSSRNSIDEMQEMISNLSEVVKKQKEVIGARDGAITSLKAAAQNLQQQLSSKNDARPEAVTTTISGSSINNNDACTYCKTYETYINELEVKLHRSERNQNKCNAEIGRLQKIVQQTKKVILAQEEVLDSLSRRRRIERRSRSASDYVSDYDRSGVGSAGEEYRANRGGNIHEDETEFHDYDNDGNVETSSGRWVGLGLGRDDPLRALTLTLTPAAKAAYTRPPRPPAATSTEGGEEYYVDEPEENSDYDSQDDDDDDDDDNNNDDDDDNNNDDGDDNNDDGDDNNDDGEEGEQSRDTSLLRKPFACSALEPLDDKMLVDIFSENGRINRMRIHVGSSSYNSHNGNIDSNTTVQDSLALSESASSSTADHGRSWLRSQHASGFTQVIDSLGGLNDSSSSSSSSNSSGSIEYADSDLNIADSAAADGAETQDNSLVNYGSPIPTPADANSPSYFLPGSTDTTASSSIDASADASFPKPSWVARIAAKSGSAEVSVEDSFTLIQRYYHDGQAGPSIP